LAFIIIPLSSVLLLSFVKQWSYPQLLYSKFTLEHWLMILTSNNDLRFSLLTSFSIAFINASTSSLIGYFISKELFLNHKNSQLIKFSFYPYLISPVILGGMLQFYFIKWGLTSTYIGVVIAQLIFIIPLGILIMSSFWSDKIRLYVNQAKSLGASDKEINKSILYPLAKPWIALCFVQSFLISWFEYGITQIIGLGKVQSLTITIMKFVNEANMHQAAVGACLMILPLIIIYFIILKSVAKFSRND
jgi:putative spermidine/putrescine transport system permease protein